MRAFVTRHERLSVGLVLLLGLLVRLPAVPVDIHAVNDVRWFIDWGRTAHDVGLTAVSANIPDGVGLYPPLSLWILDFLASVEALVPAGLRGGDTLLISMVKLLPVASDLCLAALIAWLVRGRGPVTAVVGAAAIALNPAFIYLGAAWGQIDSLYSLLLVVSTALLARTPTTATVAGAWLTWVMAALVKVQGLLLLPLVLVASVRDAGWRRAAIGVAVALLVTVVMFLPWLPHDLRRYFETISRVEARTTINALNAWYVVDLGHRRSDLHRIIGPLTPRILGYALVLLVACFVATVVWARRQRVGLALPAAVLAMAPFMVLTGMRGRYLLVALPFLILLALGWDRATGAAARGLGGDPRGGHPDHQPDGVSAAGRLVVAQVHGVRRARRSGSGGPSPRARLGHRQRRHLLLAAHLPGSSRRPVTGRGFDHGRSARVAGPSARYHRSMNTHALQVHEVQVQGHPCVAVDRGGPRMVITTDVGPRILAVALPDGTGDGLLASLPDLRIDRPGWPRFQLHGGHRLWAAPEVPETTYLPDDGPLVVEQDADSVSCTHRESVTGLSRTIRVAPSADVVVVDHLLDNRGDSTVEVAPWAITMCTPGGEAWVPRFLGATDPHGVQSNGSLVTWPYTRLADERLVLDDPIIRLRGVAGAPSPCKIGIAGRVGWIAYRLGGAVLVKRVTYLDGVAYADLGASLQCYSGGDFLEIETLGPLVTLAPGASVGHRETWSVHAVDARLDSDAALRELGLDQG